jgi:hypothetical protein
VFVSQTAKARQDLLQSGLLAQRHTSHLHFTLD